VTSQASSVSELLKRQVEHLSTLAAVLEKELQLISSREAEPLMKLLDDKSQLLEVIQKTDVEIEKAISAQGGMQAEDDALMEQAKSLLEDCKYRTQINQKAVEQGQLRLTHLRNLMMEVRAKESLTYDKKGKPKGGTLGSGVSA
jgi:flagella synthesis protein FlgN